MGCSFRSIPLAAAFTLVLGLSAAVGAHAQNSGGPTYYLAPPITLRATPPASTASNPAYSASARSAAWAARASLGWGTRAAGGQSTASTTADVQSLRDENLRLKIALARAEAEGGGVPAATVARAAAPAAAIVVPAEAAAPVAAASAAVVATERKFDPEAIVAAEKFTGLLIDARDLPQMQRSSAPVIYGPTPYQELLYPDPKHVPTPDQVQEESVVRYYNSFSDAFKGYVGDHPLVIHAVAALGPGTDCPSISAEDMALLKALDRKIHFSQDWRVGILLSENK